MQIEFCSSISPPRGKSDCYLRNSSKFSPKVIRKQTAGLPRALNESGMGVSMMNIKDHVKTDENPKKGQNKHLDEIVKVERSPLKQAQTINNFYHSNKV